MPGCPRPARRAARARAATSAGMSVKREAPRRGRPATATSLAALRTAGASPPRAKASRASAQRREALLVGREELQPAERREVQPPPGQRRRARGGAARPRSGCACPAARGARAARRRPARPRRARCSAGARRPRCARAAAPKSQCASMTSSPLFISVAESIVTLAPMLQLGWRSASSGVTAVEVALAPQERPAGGRQHDAADLAPGRVPRAAGRARCARCPPAGWRRPAARTAAVIAAPAATSDSLLASATILPARAASQVGRMPAAPTIAESTTSASASAAARAAAPRRRQSTSTPVPASSRRRGPLRRRVGDHGQARAQLARLRGQRAASSSRRRAPRPRARPPEARTTSSALTPIEPVEPRIATRRIAAGSGRERPREVVGDRDREQQAVDAVEDAAVPRDERPGVLDALGALPERLEEVAELPGDADREADRRPPRTAGAPPANSGAARTGARERPREPADRTGPGLVRAQQPGRSRRRPKREPAK